MESGMSGLHKSKGDTAHDITHEWNVVVVGLSQMFYSLVGVLWVESSGTEPPNKT